MIPPVTPPMAQYEQAAAASTAAGPAAQARPLSKADRVWERYTAAWICQKNIEAFRARLATALKAEEQDLLRDLLTMEEIRLAQIAAAPAG